MASSADQTSKFPDSGAAKTNRWPSGDHRGTVAKWRPKSVRRRGAVPSAGPTQTSVEPSRLERKAIRLPLAAAELAEVDRRLSDRGFILEFLAALYRGGVLLTTGTDSHTAWAIAGISLHDELALFAEAGLSPYEALRTATVHGAAVLGIEGEAGTIEPGKRADLVLVAGNPLADLATLRHPEAVIAAGRWYDAEDLRLLIAEAPGT